MNNIDLDNMSDKELMELARRRVKLKSRLALSAAAYLTLNFFMLLIWLFSLTEDFWPKWVMLGTGLLLIIYAVFVFIEIGNIANPDKVIAEYKRLKRTQRKKEAASDVLHKTGTMADVLADLAESEEFEEAEESEGL